MTVVFISLFFSARMVMSVSSAVTAIVDAAATAPFRMSRTHVADRWALYNIIIILSDKVKVLFFSLHK